MAEVRRLAEIFPGTVIQQCLFGYDRGHRLLNSSVELPSAAARTLLVASDFPVGTTSKHERGVLTGFPLAEFGLYAFSSTWAAPEMPRPGCVWTHTLLIPFAALGRIPDLAVLLNVFRRPLAGATKASYVRGIPEDTLPTVVDRRFPIRPGRAGKLLMALYGEPTSIVEVVAEDEDAFREWTALACEVWSQQWPRLRRSFRISTRESADRSGNPQISDLQIVRFDVSSRHAHAAEVIARPGLESFEPIDAYRGRHLGIDWADIAGIDLLSVEPCVLRPFLKRYGADASGGRAAFAGLASAYCALVDPDANSSAQNFGRVLGKEFEGTNEVAKLKADVIGGRIAFPAINATSRFEWLMMMLLEVGDVRKILNADVVSKALGESFDALPVYRRFEIASDGFAFEELGWTAGALANLALEASIDEVIEGTRGRWDLFCIFARDRVELLLDPRISATENGRNALKDAVLNESIDPVLFLKFGYFVEDEALVRHIFARCAFVAIDCVISALERAVTIPKIWIDAAFENVGDLLRQMVDRPAVNLSTILLILERCGARNPDVRALGPSSWAHLLSKARNNLVDDDFLRAAAHILALAMDQPRRGAEGLMAFSFDPLHAAAARDRIGDAWFVIEPFLPDSWDYWGWDRCRRLRMGVCNAYIYNDLDPSTFASITRSTKTFKAIINEMNVKWQGGDFLRQVFKLEKVSVGRPSKMIKAIEKIVASNNTFKP